MAFDQLFQIEASAQPAQLPLLPVARRKPSKKATQNHRGCSYCPLDKVPGINKVKGQMTGKKIWVVAQSPGMDENEEKKELVGIAGRWLWKELHRIGVRRKDVDIQNVVRCVPADMVEGSYDSYLKMRSPTPEEIKCCSIYTEEAIAQSKAPFVLVFGQIAAKALLQTRSLPQRKIFWSEELSARIYLLDHPAFFVRGYAPPSRLAAFRKILDEFKKDFVAGDTAALSDQYAYIRKQDYRLIKNKKQALAAEKIVRSYAAKNRRVAVDVEDHDGVVMICGFSPKPGLSFVFVFSHKEQNESDGSDVQQVAARMLEDGEIKKALHYG